VTDEAARELLLMGAGIPISLRKVDTEFYAAVASLRAGKLGWFSVSVFPIVLCSGVLAGCSSRPSAREPPDLTITKEGASGPGSAIVTSRT
jgi:hypothetical protein